MLIRFRPRLSDVDNSTGSLLIGFAFASTVSYVIRYRFLNMYSRLPPEPQRKEPEIELFPDVQEGDSKRGFSNYLDEFLSAIKVFGYLERSVFHELTRTMQTRKLVAGETILLEEEHGFCLVVDGLVQIFVKSKRDESKRHDEDEADEEEEEGQGSKGNQGYQLLTEVKNGAPMSSLFSILSLFTEDVKLRHDEDEQDLHSDIRTRSMQSGATTPFSDLDNPQLSTSPRGSVPLSMQVPFSGRGGLPNVPPLYLDTLSDENPPQLRKPQSGSRSLPKQEASAHPDIVGRATVDTTIAIIPATAFRRLTRVYPRASAHIVQVILTRLQRVTLSTGHAYLGLTSEVLRSERLMNKYTTYDLPGFLRGAALDRLKDKFAAVRLPSPRMLFVKYY